MASELIVAAIVASMVHLGKHLENWYDSLAAVDKLGSVVDLPIERQDGQSPPLAPGPGSIELIDLTFAYPGARPLFESLSLRVAPGERLAITGPIGSGAGTLLDLVYSLRNATEGIVRVQGVDVRSWNLADLRQQVVLVRETEFVEGTLAENIGLGRPGPVPGGDPGGAGSGRLRQDSGAASGGLEHRIQPDPAVRFPADPRRPGPGHRRFPRESC